MSQRRIKHRSRADIADPAQIRVNAFTRTAPPLPLPVKSGGENSETARLRWCFLLALNQLAPAFWLSLRDVHLRPELFQVWAVHWHVVDDWLLDAVRAVLAYWKRYPDSPQARLEPGIIQYFGKAAIDEVQPFHVEFSDPIPRVSWPENYDTAILTIPVDEHAELNAKVVHEDLDAFEARHRAQFDERMKAYKRDYRNGHHSLVGYLETHRGLKDHMGWLVCRFTGKLTVREVADRWSTLASSEDPEGTIVRKVNELAGKMGIDLKPWTRK